MTANLRLVRRLSSAFRAHDHRLASADHTYQHACNQQQNAKNRTEQQQKQADQPQHGTDHSLKGHRALLGCADVLVIAGHGRLPLFLSRQFITRRTALPHATYLGIAQGASLSAGRPA